MYSGSHMRLGSFGVLPSSSLRFGSCLRGQLKVKKGVRRRPLPAQANIFEDFERWRSDSRQKAREARLEAKDRKEKFKQSLEQQPVVIAIQNCLAAIRRLLDPLYRLFNYIIDGLVDFSEGFEKFSTDECKRMWRWRRENEGEVQFWLGVLRFARGVFFCLVYEIAAPTTVLLGVLFPMAVGFFLCDRFFTSPQALAVYVALPIKVLFSPLQWI